MADTHVPSGHPPALQRHAPLELQSYVEYLRKFLKESGLSLTAFVLSLYFLYRYWQNKTRALEGALPPQTPLAMRGAASMDLAAHCSPLASFRLFVAAVTLSDKYLHDASYSSVYWRRVCNITFNSHAAARGCGPGQRPYRLTPSGCYFTLAGLNAAERELLQDLDYALFIKAEDLSAFVLCLRRRLLLEEFQALQADTHSMSYREMSLFYRATEMAASLTMATTESCCAPLPALKGHARATAASAVWLDRYANPTTVLYALCGRVLYCLLAYVVAVLLVSLLVKTAITMCILSLARFLHHQEFQLNSVFKLMEWLWQHAQGTFEWPQ